MLLTIAGIVIGLIVGFGVSLIIGFVEDKITMADSTAVNDVMDCENIKDEDWNDLCKQNKSTFNTGTGIIQLAGFLVPFGAIAVACAKIDGTI